MSKPRITPEQQHWRDVGYHFFEGVMKSVVEWLIVLLLFALFLHAAGYLIVSPDDSDFSRWDRSGVDVITDAKTGRQYLKTREGFLVPRETRQ